MTLKQRWEAALSESSLLKKLRQTWDGVEPKHRPLFMLLGAIALVALIGSLVVAPAWDYSKQAEARVIAAQTDLSWMQSNAGQILDKQGQNQDYGSLIELTLSSAEASGLNISRYEPESQNLRIWIESASLPNCMRWLLRLQQEFGVGFSELDVDRNSSTGLSSIRLVLGPGL